MENNPFCDIIISRESLLPAGPAWENTDNAPRVLQQGSWPVGAGLP